MRKVADGLGVTATALYHHFANRQALLDSVADRAFSDFERRLRSLKSSEPSEIIRGVLDGYRQFAADEPHLFGLMFVEPRRSARKFPADFAAHRSAVFNLLWKAVGDCIAVDGLVDPDESLYLAHDLWALTHGQILLWRAGRFVDEPAFRRVLSRAIDHFIDTL
jgi:Transcriptional regulator